MPSGIIRIKQIGSPIGSHLSQRETLTGLGLNRMGRVVKRADSPEIRGMIEKVRHLVRIVSPEPGEILPLSLVRFNALAGYLPRASAARV